MRRLWIPLFLLLFCATGAAAAELRVLVYNTHGLPSWIAGDDPERRFPKIGEHLNVYDLVLLQEDFEHHEALRSTAQHGFVQRGNPSRESVHCWISCSGSGLTLLAALPRERLLRVDNVPYGVCAGWFGGANDCLATKGFQHARLEISPGLVLHVVNTHLDAGSGAEDRAARAQQLEILREHLAENARGEALVVAGDLNLDDAAPADAQLRDEFAAALGLLDSGARGAAENGWTVLDYVYFREGSELGVRILDAREADEFRDGGQPLSDHPALAVRFELYRRLAVPPSTGITAPVR